VEGEGTDSRDPWGRRRQLIELYAQSLDTYDRRYRETQFEKFQHCVIPLRSRIEAVVDVGCGSGLLLEFLVDLWQEIPHPDGQDPGGVYVGLDLSRAMLRRGRTKIPPRRDSPRLVAGFVEADGNFLPLRRACTHRGFCFSLLQNLPDPVAFLREFARVLAPNPTAVVISELKKKRPFPAFQRLVGAVFEQGAFTNPPGSEDHFYLLPAVTSETESG